MAKTWYPVIDYMLCEECGICNDFCRHDVYDRAKAPSPVVTNPDGCIENCHGCGNLCPAGAITYVGENTNWTPPFGEASDDAICGCGEGCACGSGCGCSDGTDCTDVNVEFLYLDLETCERCMATDSTVDFAVDALRDVLLELGYRMNVNKVNIQSAEMAEQYRFLSSPTIRVNGTDICTDVQENACSDCGDICGSDMECRVFVYKGEAYDQPPKAMIMDGILRAIFAPKVNPQETPYVLSENLKTFFSGSASHCSDACGSCECECECK